MKALYFRETRAPGGYVHSFALMVVASGNRPKGVVSMIARGGSGGCRNIQFWKEDFMVAAVGRNPEGRCGEGTVN